MTFALLEMTLRLFNIVLYETHANLQRNVVHIITRRLELRELVRPFVNVNTDRLKFITKQSYSAT